MGKPLTAFQLQNAVKKAVPKSSKDKVFGVLDSLGFFALTPRGTYVINPQIEVTATKLPEIIQKVIEECTH